MAIDDRAVVVGISRYPVLGALQGPENDALGFRDWLVSPTGGAVQPDNVRLILSSQYPANGTHPQPTLVEVNDAFDELARLAYDNERVGRRLYIFLAGHGFAPMSVIVRRLDAALLMANATHQRLGEHIPGDLYAQWFDTAGAFDEIILFMDSCRDDYGYMPVNSPPWQQLKTRRQQQVHFFYAFATKWSRQAREKSVVNGGPVQGLFSRALLMGLQGYARDSDSRITGRSLMKFIKNYLSILYDHLNIRGSERQVPEFVSDDHEAIVFTEHVPHLSTHIRITFTALPEAGMPVVIKRHDLQTVTEKLVRDSVWEMDLPPGMYILLATDSSQEKLFTALGDEVYVEV